MNYTRTLKRAVEITWHYKALWPFGFLLAFLSGSGGINQGIQYVVSSGKQTEPRTMLTLTFFALSFALMLIVVSLLVGCLSRGALIGMVQEVEEASGTSIRSGWRTGWSRFLPLFAIDLVIGIPTAIIAFLLIILGLSPLILLLAQRRALTVLAIALTVFFMLLVVGLLVIIGVVLSVISELAYRQCVLDKKSAPNSISDGFRMGLKNLKNVSVIWLLLLAIDLALGLVATPLFLVVFAMAAAPGVLVYLATKALIPALVLAVPPVSIAFLLTSLLEGVHQVFRSAVWTLAYRELRT